MEEQILDQNLAGSGEPINYDEKFQKLINAGIQSF